MESQSNAGYPHAFHQISLIAFLGEERHIKGEESSLKTQQKTCNISLKHLATLIVGSCCEGVGQMHATPCNTQKCCNKNLIIFKLDSTPSNILQHVVTGFPNLCNTLHATVLQDVALKC